MATRTLTTGRMGFVYVIASIAGPVKIGHSVRPDIRLVDLQCGSHSLLAMAFAGAVPIPDHRRIERWVHRQFSAQRLLGEWFDVTSSEAISAIRSGAKKFGVHMIDRTDGFLRSDEKVEGEFQDEEAAKTLSSIRVFIDSKVEPYFDASGSSEVLIAALAAADSFAKAEKSEQTRKSYESHLRRFADWCSATGSRFMPASVDTVAAHLASLAEGRKSTSTIMVRLAAIAYAHRQLGHDDPTHSERVKSVLRGIRRTLGTAQKQKAPATAKFIKAMVKASPDTILGKRDRAILLIGFGAALRRSELVALNVDDIERQPEGILIHIRRSKTDQEGAGHTVAVPRGTKLKPVAALDDWLKAAGISSGAIFRPINKGGRVLAGRLTDQSVALVVKHRAAAAKLDPKMFAGHSLRAGFVTSALEDGADALRVMDQTRHRSVDTLRKYDRRAKAFVSHAGKGFL